MLCVVAGQRVVALIALKIELLTALFLSFLPRCQRLSFVHMLCVCIHVPNRHNEILNNSSAWILSHGESKGDENKRKTSAPERVTLKVNFVINYQEIDYRVCVVGYFQCSLSYFSLLSLSLVYGRNERSRASASFNFAPHKILEETRQWCFELRMHRGMHWRGGNLE